MIKMHGESALGVQKGPEEVLRHRRHSGRPVRYTFTSEQNAALSRAMEAIFVDTNAGKWDENTVMYVDGFFTPERTGTRTKA